MGTPLKVACKVYAARLQKTLDMTGVSPALQGGFHLGYEATAHVVCLVEILQRRRLEGMNTYVAFIDLKKAFVRPCPTRDFDTKK